MNKRGLIRYVFTSSHTSQGFYTFIPELINGLGRVYILKGAPGSGKSTFIRLIGELMSERGFEVEFWISALDSITPDGVYIPQLDLAVINGSLPESIEPRYPGVRDQLINLGEYWDREIIQVHREEIIDLVDQMGISQQEVYSLLKEAGRVKEEIRRINSQQLNMEKLEKLIQQLGTEILENRPGEKHYFAGAVTADGLVDYVYELSNACQKRYIFKGPSGSGKSMVINELARQARARGYFLEYYHCGLEVESLVMIIIRNLQIALIEADGVEIPLKPWDVVVDLNNCLDADHAVKLKEGTSINYRNFESLLLEAQHGLEKTNQINKELKKIYAAAMNFSSLDQIRLKLMDEIQDRD